MTREVISSKYTAAQHVYAEGERVIIYAIEIEGETLANVAMGPLPLLSLPSPEEVPRGLRVS
jgi:hypothetical protein